MAGLLQVLGGHAHFLRLDAREGDGRRVAGGGMGGEEEGEGEERGQARGGGPQPHTCRRLAVWGCWLGGADRGLGGRLSGFGGLGMGLFDRVGGWVRPTCVWVCVCVCVSR